MYSDFAISDGSGQGGKVPDYLETVVAGKGITTTTVSAQPTQLQPNSLQPAVTCAVQQPQTVIQPAFSMAGTGQHLISSTFYNLSRNSAKWRHYHYLSSQALRFNSRS